MMLEEQKNTIAVFRKNINKAEFKNFAVYGTGINAEAVIENCGDYEIAGVIDTAKTGQIFCGLPVLPLEETEKRDIKKIVIIARPAVLTIIYRRIREWCVSHNIEVYDIYGTNMESILDIQICDSPYFKISFEELINEIDSHEIISFDIFDTALMRKVYEPTDVFLLLDLELNGKLPYKFSNIRKEAEKKLLETCNPDLNQIYDYIEKTYHLSNELCSDLKDRELRKEREVLTVRERIRECIKYCNQKGKRWFFVSDMYLTSGILKEFLEDFGISGYEDVIVSCEYNVSKSTGLFQVLKERIEGKTCLHVGDNKESDYDAAREAGIDAFLIMSAVRMMEVSTYKNALVYLKGIESRVMLGLLASRVFNDPFVLYESQGKPLITKSETFGSIFIGPLIVSYLVWLFKTLIKRDQGLLLFASRDGWIVQKAYHILKEKWKVEKLPEDIYFMISRRVVLEKDDESANIRYKKYLESLGLDRYKEIYFFDFMSRGTCQAGLEKLIERKLTGVYFQRSVSEDAEKNAADVKAYFKEISAHGNDLRIFAMCDFLECIITSYEPSFAGIDESGYFVYEIEKRSDGQLEYLRRIHKGVLEYCVSFPEIIKSIPVQMPPPEFCDEILKYTDARFSRIDISELEEFMLDDWLGGDKNTGRDILT